MKSTTKTKWLVWSAVAAFFILIAAITYPAFSSRRYVTKAMKVLHGTSTHTSRSYRGAGVGGFFYQMKGPLAEPELRKIAKDLDLTKFDPEQHGALSDTRLKDFVLKRPWWNEASSLDHYYFRNSLDDRFVVRARWENGQIYFLAVEPGSLTL